MRGCKQQHLEVVTKVMSEHEKNPFIVPGRPNETTHTHLSSFYFETSFR